MELQTCLVCGMDVVATADRCPKCDNDLRSQHDGSTFTIDIAHQGERVSEALRKMQKEIDWANQGVVMNIRLVVGSGLIRDKVILALRDLEQGGGIKNFNLEPNNAGAILVRLKWRNTVLVVVKIGTNFARYYYNENF